MGDEYFKSTRDKLVFLLVEVEGEKRNQLLGITRELYQDKEKAKEWYENVKSQLLEDPSGVGDVNKAVHKLDELYKMLTL